MNSFIILSLLGLLIGTFGTLIGAGGGFLLVPLLLLAYPKLPPGVVTAISMAIVAFNAISGSVAYSRSKRIDYKAGLLFAAATIPGSILGVFATEHIPHNLFNILFGVLLLVLSTYLFIKNKKKKEGEAPAPLKTGKGWIQRTLVDKYGTVFNYSYNQPNGIFISILVGFISPLLGIGGGIIHVPAMVQWLQFPVHIATATSHFILAIMSAISVGVHAIQGHYNDPEVLKMVGALTIGVIPGAQLGAYLSHKIPTHTIIKSLAVCLALVAIRILLKH